VDDSVRRQRWAAFSVKAHRNLDALASDVLLYDRIILPIPEDDAEHGRWVRNAWAPDEQPLRVVQSAGHIIPVPWTQQLRQEWRTAYDQMRGLSAEVAFGATGQIYASSPQAWQEIFDPACRGSARPETVPHRRLPVRSGGGRSAHPRRVTPDTASAVKGQPGERPADRAVALRVRRIVDEPDIADPQEAFLASDKLADDPKFVAARRRLSDWEDKLYVDQWEPVEIERELVEIDEQYNATVRDFTRKTRRHRAASLLPGAVGATVALTGHPHLKWPISKALSWVVGRFVPAPTTDPRDIPGHAFALIRAAYRDLEARQTPD